MDSGSAADSGLGANSGSGEEDSGSVAEGSGSGADSGSGAGSGSGEEDSGSGVEDLGLGADSGLAEEGCIINHSGAALRTHGKRQMCELDLRLECIDLTLEQSGAGAVVGRAEVAADWWREA